MIDVLANLPSPIKLTNADDVKKHEDRLWLNKLKKKSLNKWLDIRANILELHTFWDLAKLQGILDEQANISLDETNALEAMKLRGTSLEWIFESVNLSEKLTNDTEKQKEYNATISKVITSSLTPKLFGPEWILSKHTLNNAQKTNITTWVSLAFIEKWLRMYNQDFLMMIVEMNTGDILEPFNASLTTLWNQNPDTLINVAKNPELTLNWMREILNHPWKQDYVITSSENTTTDSWTDAKSVWNKLKAMITDKNSWKIAAVVASIWTSFEGWVSDLKKMALSYITSSEWQEFIAWLKKSSPLMFFFLSLLAGVFKIDLDGFIIDSPIKTADDVTTVHTALNANEQLGEIDVTNFLMKDDGSDIDENAVTSYNRLAKTFSVSTDFNPSEQIILDEGFGAIMDWLLEEKHVVDKSSKKLSEKVNTWIMYFNEYVHSDFYKKTDGIDLYIESKKEKEPDNKKALIKASTEDWGDSDKQPEVISTEFKPAFNVDTKNWLINMIDTVDWKAYTLKINTKSGFIDISIDWKKVQYTLWKQTQMAEVLVKGYNSDSESTMIGIAKWLVWQSYKEWVFAKEVTHSGITITKIDLQKK